MSVRFSLAGRTVLVIDDNEAVRTALEVLLSLHSASVVGAASPAEGLTALKAHSIDLVRSEERRVGKECVP